MLTFQTFNGLIRKSTEYPACFIPANGQGITDQANGTTITQPVTATVRRIEGEVMPKVNDHRYGTFSFKEAFVKTTYIQEYYYIVVSQRRP